MENNNTNRNARLYYEGESIPVLVVGEDERSYELLLSWSNLSDEATTFKERDRKRDLYLDAIFGYARAHEVHDDVVASRTSVYLEKHNPDVTLEFVEAEPEEAQGEPTEMTEPDNVVPFLKVPRLTDLEKQLILLGHADYKVKSFDVSFQEGGEAQLCASFTKEVDK